MNRAEVDIEEDELEIENHDDTQDSKEVKESRIDSPKQYAKSSKDIQPDETEGVKEKIKQSTTSGTDEQSQTTGKGPQSSGPVQSSPFHAELLSGIINKQGDEDAFEEDEHDPVQGTQETNTDNVGEPAQGGDHQTPPAKKTPRPQGGREEGHDSERVSLLLLLPNTVSFCFVVCCLSVSPTKC